MSAYSTAFARARDDSQAFWYEAALGVDWFSAPSQAISTAASTRSQWFADGTLNTCHNAVDRHVAAGNGDRVALIWDSAMLGQQLRYTYAELLDQVARFAGALASQGVRAGDRVVIYMPMIPEATFAMLACARLGAVHSVVFGGFAAPELAARINDAEPTAIITASGGLEPGKSIEYLPLVSKAIELAASKPATVIVKNRTEIAGSAAEYEGWLDWDELMVNAPPTAAVALAATDPLYILYTSGTTGKPKGVVRDNGGHAVALIWSMHHIYNIKAGDVWWAASDVGWVVGHSYIVYAPLLIGATTVMFEGKPVGTPDAGAFWRVVDEHSVNAIFTAPTAIRAIRKSDPDANEIGKYDTSSLRTLFLGGERLDPDTYEWASTALAVPVIDHWWQTETGWPIAANLRGLEPMPIKPGSPSVAVPGYQLNILDAAGAVLPPNIEGNIAIKLPLPPGTLSGLWRDEERYRDSYLSSFPGYYTTGDSGYIDDDGYIFVMGRTDDVINVAGHRLSTGSIETVVAAHPAVAECAVIGLSDELKGQRPSAYVVLISGADIHPYVLEDELIKAVRNEIGAIASFRNVTVVPALPKTRSGKILRKTIRQIAEKEDYVVPSTVEDPQTVSALEALLQ